MKRTPLILTVVAATLVGVGCATTDNLVHTAPHPQLARQGAAIIGPQLDTQLLDTLLYTYINLFRSKHLLSRFDIDPYATRSARWMAQYQANIGAVTHEASASGMQTVGKRYTSSGGPEYAFSGENASWTPFFDADLGRNLTYDEMARRILDNWINSPHHFQNLVLKSSEVRGGIGVGSAQGMNSGWDGVYSTMDAVFQWPETDLEAWQKRSAARIR
jgi:uncharacterized protein YkwD